MKNWLTNVAIMKTTVMAYKDTSNVAWATVALLPLCASN